MFAVLLDPGQAAASRQDEALVLPPMSKTTTALATRSISGLDHTASTLAVYASQAPLLVDHARLASAWWLAFGGRDSDPLGSLRKVSRSPTLLRKRYFPPSPGLAWRTLDAN